MIDSSLTLGSLFDGSGGFLFGGLMCGIRPSMRLFRTIRHPVLFTVN